MLEKRDLKRLRARAERLRQAGTYWRDCLRIEHVMGWLYDGDGKCGYCGVELVESGHTLSGTATTDHLLPKGRYPHLDADPLNALPACATCIHLKGQFDPNKFGTPLLNDGDNLNPSVRAELIARTKAHLEDKLTKRRVAFQSDLVAWRDRFHA